MTSRRSLPTRQEAVLTTTYRTEPHTPAHPTSQETYGGLSKREHFAALALQGVLAQPNMTDLMLAAERAVSAADFLIEELNGAPEASR